MRLLTLTAIAVVAPVAGITATPAAASTGVPATGLPAAAGLPATTGLPAAAGVPAAPRAGSDDGERRLPPFHHCSVTLRPDRPPVTIRAWAAPWAPPVGQLRWGDVLRASCAVTDGVPYSNWQCGRGHSWIRVNLGGPFSRVGYVPLGCVRWFRPAWPPLPPPIPATTSALPG